MQRFLAFFLAALMLLQTLGREVLVLDYQLNKARITELYCVNKAKPELRCNGKCHLASQLRKADGGDQKAPTASVGKVKYEALPTVAYSLRPPLRWPTTPRYRTLLTALPAAVPSTGVFRPPLLQV